MASADINLSLDDIIKKNKPFRNVNSRRKPNARQLNNKRKNNFINGRSPGGRINKPRNQNNQRNGSTIRYSPYKRGDVDGAWSHDLYDGGAVLRGRNLVDYDVGGTKLVISNLDFGVTESDLEELFLEIGVLVHCEVHYDRSGRSIGTGSVEFENRKDALRAINTYNGVPLDGRPMQIELAASAPSNVIGTNRLGVRNSNRNSGIRPMSGRRHFSGGNRGKNFVGQRNRNSNSKTPLSAEQLDAELDDYRTKGL